MAVYVSVPLAQMVVAPAVNVGATVVGVTVTALSVEKGPPQVPVEVARTVKFAVPAELSTPLVALIEAPVPPTIE